MTAMKTIHPVSEDQIRPSRGQVIKFEWTELEHPRREFLAVLCPEEEGGFSVFAAHIPGVVSQGETEEEARSNIAEAFTAMAEACAMRGESMPYSTEPILEFPADCQRTWLVLNG